MKIKLLVTGSTGQLGTEFCNELSEKFEIIGVNRKAADITNYQQVAVVIKQNKPEFVLHTAAFTDVDGCEEDNDKAMAVNATGARNVALASKKAGATVIYFSTDYVFNGRKNSAYTESDTPDPISRYGYSKYLGEKGTQEFNENHIVIRTGWIYSPYRKNFIKSIVSAGKKQQAAASSGKKVSPLRVVDDQFGSPTWASDVVKQTLRIIESNQRGLFHVAAKGETSRFGWAKLILQKLMPDVSIEACSMKDFPRPASRPMRSSLQSERLEKLGINVMRSYDVALEEFLTNHGKQLLNETIN